MRLLWTFFLSWKLELSLDRRATEIEVPGFMQAAGTTLQMWGLVVEPDKKY